MLASSSFFSELSRRGQGERTIATRRILIAGQRSRITFHSLDNRQRVIVAFLSTPTLHSLLFNNGLLLLRQIRSDVLQFHHLGKTHARSTRLHFPTF